MNAKRAEKDNRSPRDNPAGKGLRPRLKALRSRPALTYLVIFLVLMAASLLMYTAEESGSQVGVAVLLLLMILANLLTLVF
jgi:hypothetical protein